MSFANDRSGKGYESGPTCASGSTIVYAWALDADKTELPKGLIDIQNQSNEQENNNDILFLFYLKMLLSKLVDQHRLNILFFKCIIRIWINSKVKIIRMFNQYF